MQNRIKRYLNMIPIVIAIGIIPLIMRVGLHSNEALSGYPWFTQEYGTYADIFFAGKAVGIHVLMFIMAGMLIWKAFFKKEKLPWSKVFTLLLIYTVLTIISGIISDNRELAFMGSFERFEPVGVIAGYMVIFFYAYSSIRGEEDLRLLVRYSAVLAGLMILLGLFQSFGFDPFNMTIIKKLITPVEFHDQLDNLRILRDKGVAYLTLYNEDYLGMYFGLMIPVSISLIFAFKEGWKKIIAVLFTAASLFVLYHGRSLSGWIALGFAGIVAVFILSEKSKKGAVISWICLGTILVVFFAALKLSPSFMNRVYGSISSSSGRVHKITGIETGDDEVVFYYFDGNELHCSFDFDEYGVLGPSFSDKDGNELIYDLTDGVFTLDERFEYADATLYKQEIDGIRTAMFVIDDHNWPIVLGEDGTYYYLNHSMNLVKVPAVKNIGVFDDGFLSGRGGIWNRTIPLLGSHVLLGSGANTFIAEYPQDDYVLLNYTYGWGSFYYNVKAHSLYLGNMIENGIIGTLCLIAFFVIYIVMGVRLYGNPENREGASDFTYYLGFGLFLGCVAYMIAGFVNDSNVCTAPVFWAFLGVSMAVNK